MPLRQKAPNDWPAEPVKMMLSEPFQPLFPCLWATAPWTRANRAVGVEDVDLHLDVLVLVEGAQHVLAREELVVQGARLRVHRLELRLPRAANLGAGLHVGHLADVREVEVGRLGEGAVRLAQKV